MTKVAVSTTEPSGKVYRIPLRRVFNAKHGKNCFPSWKQLYGSLKCHSCKKPMGEGDPYKAEYIVKRGRFALVIYHVDCKIVKPKVKK